MDKSTLMQDKLRAGSLVRALQKIDAPVHRDLLAAIEFGAIEFDPTVAAKRAKTELAKAKTPEAAQKALDMLAAAHPGFAARETIEVGLLTEQVARVDAALSSHFTEIVNHLADAFDPLAERFTHAAGNLPNMNTKGAAAWDYTPEQSEAIRESKLLKVDMDEIWNPYVRLCERMGYIAEPRHRVFALGEVEHVQQAQNVEHTWSVVGKTDDGKALSPAMPYWALIQQQIRRLRLDREPWNIIDRMADLMTMQSVEVGIISSAPMITGSAI